MKKYYIYDKTKDVIYEFKNKQQLKVQLVCFKEEYENVNVEEKNEFEYEVTYSE